MVGLKAAHNPKIALILIISLNTDYGRIERDLNASASS